MAATTSSTHALDRLGELREAADAAKRLPADITRERDDLNGQAEVARQALRNFYAEDRDDPKQEAKLRAAVDAAELAANQRWSERVSGATAAMQSADRDLRMFATENFAAIHAELTQRAEGVRELVRQRLEEADESFRASRRLESEWGALFSLLGLAGQRTLPPDGLEGIVNAIEGVLLNDGPTLLVPYPGLVRARLEQRAAVEAADRAPAA